MKSSKLAIANFAVATAGYTPNNLNFIEVFFDEKLGFVQIHFSFSSIGNKEKSIVLEVADKLYTYVYAKNELDKFNYKDVLDDDLISKIDVVSD